MECFFESWCSHLTNESKLAYDLSNHIKVPTRKRNNKHSGNIKTYHGRFSVLSALRSPSKVKIVNCSHLHSLESTVHEGSAIEVIIPENCFNMFHCGLVYCRTPSWFICNGEYSSNTRLFFTTVEKYFNLEYETTHQMVKQLCLKETCDVCKEKKYDSKEKMFL